MCQQKLETFTSHELGMLLWACGRLGYNPGAAFMTRSLALLQQHLPSASTQSLANVLWATAVLQHEPGQDFLRAAAASVAEQAQGYSHQSLGMALWGLASLLPAAGLLLEEVKVQKLSAQSELLSAKYDSKSLRMVQWALEVLSGKREGDEGRRGKDEGEDEGGADVPAGASGVRGSVRGGGRQRAAELEMLFE